MVEMQDKLDINMVVLAEAEAVIIITVQGLQVERLTNQIYLH